ncbi:MAG: sulfatase-like hydrolase/transferase [Planctomycetes bacterium]|nr:sulfatase-like hydrolase/transferase [Planctomycetota bacterium]
MADDQGYGDVAARGHPHLATPTLDELYRDAVRFERFYAQAPVCSPTRASVLTGRHPTRIGITGANVGHLPEGEAQLATSLHDAGYRCGHFGKWHLGTLSKTVRDSNRGGARGVAHYAPPWERGFDVCFSTEAKVPTFDPMRTPGRFAGGVGQKREGSEYGTYYWQCDANGRVSRVDEQELGGDDSALIVDRACRFIEDCVASSKPFFVVVWFHAPHLPVVASREDRARYDALAVDLQTKHYYGCLTALDRALGKLRTTLRETGQRDDTMLWYCSDNGPEGNSDESPGQTGGLRGRKRSLYEGGVRVPAFLEWPRRTRGPRVVDAPCSTSDIAPTVLASLGLDTTATQRPFDGMDVMPLLSGERSLRGAEIAFAYDAEAALIGDRYKLIGRDGTYELYDLRADAAESVDLANELPDLVHDWHSRLESWKRGLR